MPQSIFIQVGQCGNQIGYRFWDLALKEYQYYNASIDDLSSFFKVKNEGNSLDGNALGHAKARAILVDMEEGVVSEILNSSLKRIFDRQQLVTDVSGSGNNWAVGNKFYGSKYRHRLVELFRKEVEDCDNLQCFFLLHSMGGGTGSGLGTAALEYLYDEYPKVPKFVFAAYPSSDDDVITSPYNTVLANSQLINFANCVFPFHNNALINVCNKVARSQSSPKSNTKLTHKSVTSPLQMRKHNRSKAFDEMNDIIGNAILNLTCSSRFPGSLNVDINEIVLNMTPYPRLHYLIPSTSPLFSGVENCKIDRAFSDLFSQNHQLFHCCLSQGVLFAAALLCRGKVSMSDVQCNIERLKGSMNFVPWNEEGWKIGLCNIPNVCSPYSLLMLSNTSSITKYFSILKENYLKMFRKKAHLHHFLEVENMDLETFKASISDLELLIDEYNFSFENETLKYPRLSVKV